MFNKNDSGGSIGNDRFISMIGWGCAECMHNGNKCWNISIIQTSTWNDGLNKDIREKGENRRNTTGKRQVGFNEMGRDRVEL